jgi:hypothetical protein
VSNPAIISPRKHTASHAALCEKPIGFVGFVVMAFITVLKNRVGDRLIVQIDAKKKRTNSAKKPCNLKVNQQFSCKRSDITHK